jgi:serine/threonine protein kinase/tetratricopeptide (TPR) repeat protein
VNSSLLERISEALAEQYAVERELGQGGMATVFVATDLRHGRQVAIKVLRPELSAALGEERFYREIEVAAALTHPNILPLHDSGEADGLLYYVMPYIEAESLATRLEREKQLPFEDAIRITQQVARALHYAHQQGIIHRDIKPHNILLVEDQALVADFGIARVAGSLDAEKLTSTGLAVGTPHYMSPEQASPGEELDGRADVYSLGCVLYELITGQPPFLGRTVRAVLARHAVDAIPPLHVLRSTVSPTLERIVSKSIAKSPADRYRTAEDLVAALERERATGGHRQPLADRTLPRRSPRVGRRALAIVGAAGVVVIAAIATLLTRSEPSSDGSILDSNLIAVAPFRVTSPADPSFRDLEDGIPELLYVRLTGESGPRTVYPGTAGAVWERLLAGGSLTDSLAFRGARSLGAGRLILGHLLVTGDELVLNGSLFDVSEASLVARSSDVRGPVDDLLPLIDELVVELLIRTAGESEQRLRLLVGSDLAAVRAYLAGQAAFHDSRYAEAVEHFGRALDIDSTLALAGLQLAVADSYVGPGAPWTRGLNTAWAHRDKLTSRDQIFLDALAPEWPDIPPYLERLRAWQAAAQAMPDRKGIQFLWGDFAYHYGASVGFGAARAQARTAFRRVLALDPSHGPALGHLLVLAVLESDTVAAREYASAYLADPSRDYTEYYRWRLAQVEDDSGLLASFQDSIPGLDDETLESVVGSGQTDGAGIEAALTAAHTLLERGTNLRQAYRYLRYLALNRGHPGEAVEWSRLAREHSADRYAPVRDVFDAVFWEGDSATAAQVVAERGYVDEAVAPSGEPDRNSPLYIDLCAVGLWRVARHEHETLLHLIRMLRQAARSFKVSTYSLPLLCAEIIDAELASATGRPDARDLVERLDSLSRSQPVRSPLELRAAATLSAAKLLEGQGELERALGAVRRRPYSVDGAMVGLSTFLREEGRLTRLVGDREGAIRALRAYLNLRSDPEPEFLPDAERAREELDQLLSQ